MRPIQLPMLSAPRRISFAARPASFWKAVIGSLERAGGFGCTDEFRAGIATATDDGGGAGRVEAVTGGELERPISSMVGRARSVESVVAVVARPIKSRGG